MLLLEKLLRELFQDAAEYAFSDVIQCDGLIPFICIVAIVIWLVSAAYCIIKGVRDAVIEAKWKYRYNIELKELNEHLRHKKRSPIRSIR